MNGGKKDVNNAVQIAHNRDLHDAMRLNPGHYVERKPQLGKLLANLRDNDKQLFLLTNNVYKNVDYLMNFIVDLPAPVRSPFFSLSHSSLLLSPSSFLSLPPSSPFLLPLPSSFLPPPPSFLLPLPLPFLSFLFIQ